jgi:hypothetical protein
MLVNKKKAIGLKNWDGCRLMDAAIDEVLKHLLTT